jgi:hypothetical protein
MSSAVARNSLWAANFVRGVITFRVADQGFAFLIVEKIAPHIRDLRQPSLQRHKMVSLLPPGPCLRPDNCAVMESPSPPEKREGLSNSSFKVRRAFTGTTFRRERDS